MPNFRNEFEIVRHIWSTKGVKGFYAGSVPNLTRLVVRNSYKYPVLIGLPNTYNQFFNQDGRASQTKKHCIKLFTGFTIALIEAIVTCPIERLKVFLMTSNHGQQAVL